MKNTRPLTWIEERLETHKALLSLLFQERCRLCSRAVEYARWDPGVAAAETFVCETLCGNCLDELRERKPVLGFCSCELGGGRDYCLPVASGMPYDEMAKILIYKFKYNGDRLLKKDLSLLAARAWKLLSPFVDRADSVIVPVPLHWGRKFKRGFNQSELIAQGLGKLIGMPVDHLALARVKSTEPQHQLSKWERMENVMGAFKGDMNRLLGKSVVLVDDVCTSGSTLAECTREALDQGARSVAAITVARALLLME